MRAQPLTKPLWAIKWETTANSVDGVTARFYGGMNALFKTRGEARAYIDRQFGYMRTRADLRAAPHGWKMPKPVRVLLTIEEDE